MTRNALLFLFCLALSGLTTAFATPATASSHDDYLVGFHQAPGRGEERLIAGKKGKLKKKFKRLPVMKVALSESEAQALRSDPRVAYVSRNVKVQAIDPILGTDYQNSWGVAHLGTQPVHRAGFLGLGVKVAVLDSGVDYTHPELAGRFGGGIDFITPDNDPRDDNSESHGTHVAGIIAAELNGAAVVGMAPLATIYAVKVLDGGGFAFMDTVVAGIDWAIDNEMDIINLSLGIRVRPDLDDTALRDACDRAYAAGILLVAAAGNTTGGAGTWPAVYDSVIAVSATDPSDQFLTFSAIDPQNELAAPGADITSTAIGGGLLSLTGTSQAAPHVSGLAALLLAAGIADSNGDGRVADDVRRRLQETALDLGAPGRDQFFGFGRIDARAALALPVDTDKQSKRGKKEKKVERKRQQR